MGYYHLKTSEDFVVPEEQRMTTQRKRRQLLLLRKQVREGGVVIVLEGGVLLSMFVFVQIFECKSELNKRLLHLRDWKLEIIERVSEYISVHRPCAIQFLLLRSHLW